MVSFIEQTSYLFVYDPVENKANRVFFNDFVVPNKSRSIVTYSGKVILIGGEIDNTDGKYSSSSRE